MNRIRKFLIDKRIAIFAIFSFLIPLIIYVLTLEHKLIGGDTSWYAIQIPEMSLMVPTGYPTFSMLEKLFTFLPIGDLAYRLNLFSAVFGALTILFLFLSINKLVKNEIISFISSMIFAFIVPFWEVANRLEFDTLNSFFIILLFFSAIIYNENKTRKYLYFFFFCLGLSLTNHPLAFFLVPAIVLYVIIINPRIFKSIKAICISILYFILPLLSYLYLPIRSLQGYGEVTTPLRLFYYITGRHVTGELHGGRFGDRSILSIFLVLKDYIVIVYKSYGIVLLIIALIGLIFLIRKKTKFGLCTLFLVILNFTIPPLYTGHALRNYLLNSMIVFSFYMAFGMLFIINWSISIFNKSIKNKKVLQIDNLLKYFLITIIILFFTFLPFSLLTENYSKLDLSKTPDVYEFWDEAFNNMESNSIIFILSRSENIAMYLDKYVYGEKNIEYIKHDDPEYTVENIIKALDNGKTVYFVDDSRAFEFLFDAEKIGETYYWDRFDEVLKLFKVKGQAVDVEISYFTDSYTREFGERFTIEYTIENKSGKSIKISSLELELPDNIEFLRTIPSGYIDQDPGLSRGMYMWVSDSYIIKGEGKINLIVELRGTRPGKSVVKFRLTTNKVYIDCDDIEIEIKD